MKVSELKKILDDIVADGKGDFPIVIGDVEVEIGFFVDKEHADLDIAMLEEPTLEEFRGYDSEGIEGADSES